MYLISVFPCCSVIFPIYGRKYSMKACGKHVGIFLMFFLLHTKLIFPCMQGNFSYVFFSVPYKVNIPMNAGGFKQVPYKEYICWIQVKIHISDQTSLRICNSVEQSKTSLLTYGERIFKLCWVCQSANPIKKSFTPFPLFFCVYPSW